MKMTSVALCCLALVVAVGLAAWGDGPEPLRPPNGEPLIMAYYFGHWWEPWKSEDAAVLADLMRLRQMGINAIGVDHEASQAMDRDCFWLDREHRLAKAAGVAILPWLSPKTWADMTSAGRREWTRQRWGTAVGLETNWDGQPTVLPYAPGTIDVGVAYTSEYLERYLDSGALLRVLWSGKPRPVVALTVEAAWPDMGGTGPESAFHFSRWLRDKYQGDIERLNRAWGTQYSGFFAVDPRDKAAFDYDGYLAAGAPGLYAESSPGKWQAVADHIEFRARITSDALAAMKERLRARYPDLLVLAELPYQFGSLHPHAIGYAAYNAAVPAMVDYADIILLRTTGDLDEREQQLVLDYIQRTGKPVIAAHRISPGQGPGAAAGSDEEVAERYARQAATYCSGLGYYSWNEMVDVHTVADPPGWTGGSVTVSEEQSARLQERMRRINERYLALCGSQ